MLGTILPTAKSLKLDDLYEKQVRKHRQSIAEQQGLDKLSRRVVGGEVRYYDTTDQYAIVARTGKVLWFQVTPDGDYRI